MNQRITTDLLKQISTLTNLETLEIVNGWACGGFEREYVLVGPYIRKLSSLKHLNITKVSEDELKSLPALETLEIERLLFSTHISKTEDLLKPFAANIVNTQLEHIKKFKIRLFCSGRYMNALVKLTK